MVTDSILSVIIFKWAVINDVSVVRVLQAPGWMTSALRLRLPSFFKLSLSHTHAHAVSDMLPRRYPELLVSLCVTHTHTQRTGEGRESGNKSPGAKHNIDPAIHFY